MNEKGREIALGVIACLLLIIYILTLGNIILSVLNWDPNKGDYVSNMNAIWVVNLIGGIVSGVVIGNLAVNDPGATPINQVQTIANAYGKRLMQAIIWIYLGAWLLIGASSFYVGVIKCPNVFDTLTEIGKSWLGILVGALYAWFGIKKSQT
jgi:hypothetical protein